MNQERFDELAKGLANNSFSRRQVLKSFVAGVLLAGPLGALWPSRDAQAFHIPPGSECPVPSRCGTRQYCNVDETCICIQSAEGAYRCGRLPSTCDLRLCQTSADCADLGEGYFCDTPNTGCCSDPPQELARCIAPCVAAPPEPPEPCASDPMTADSLAAARNALAAGATTVKLSPLGCVSYKRTLVSGRITHEEMTFDGTPAVLWDHTATRSKGRRDLDQDGFFEWRATTQRSSWIATDASTVMSEFVPATQALVGRQTYARTGSVVHTKIEEADASGAMQVVAEFDTGLTEASTHFDEAAAEGPYLAAAAVKCTAGQLKKIKAAFKEASRKGLECLRRHGRWDLAFSIGLDMAVKAPRYTCTPKPELPDGTFEAASINGPAVQANWMGTKVQINANSAPNGFFTEDNGISIEQRPLDARASTLFHEMSHISLGPGSKDHSGNNREADNVWACEDICFDTAEDPWTPTKCQCAICLETRTSDTRCDSFRDCEGGPCPAENLCEGVCCPGPCAPEVGVSCCPALRICTDAQNNETCCPSNQQCIESIGDSRFCCSAQKACPETLGGELTQCCDGSCSCGLATCRCI